MTFPIKSTLAALAFLSAAASPAWAEPAAQAATTEIDISGLDLTQQKGAEIAYVRIKQAARQVCDMPRGAAPVRHRLAAKACMTRAVDRAVEAVGSRQLALAQQRDRARG